MSDVTDDTTTHPDDDTLDRLRAGLLEPREAEAIEAHVRQCETCASQTRHWERIAATLDDAPAPRARSVHPAGRRAGALAMAATLALAVGVALVLGRPAGETGTTERPAHDRVAEHERPSGAATPEPQFDMAERPRGDSETGMATSTMTAEEGGTGADAPDLYTNIDFYMWLKSRDRNHPTSNGASSS